MPAKKPMGELPKRNSNLAKFIAGTKSNKLNPAQSRAAAGKYREIVKATGAKTMDQTGVALGKAIKKTQALAKPVKKAAASKKPSTSYSPWAMGATEAGKINTRADNNQVEFLAKQEAAKKKKAAAVKARAVAKSNPLNQLKKMNEMPARPAKTLLPKKKAR